MGERNKLNAEIKGLQTELKLDTLTAPDFSPIIPDRAHREAVAKRVVELEPRWREPPSGGGPLADAGAVGAEGGHWEVSSKAGSLPRLPPSLACRLPLPCSIPALSCVAVRRLNELCDRG